MLTLTAEPTKSIDYTNVAKDLVINNPEAAQLILDELLYWKEQGRLS